MNNNIKKLNRALRRNYTFIYKDNELIIKNKIYVYELFMIRKFVSLGNFKGIKNIRIEG